MRFELDDAIAILARTPATLTSLLDGLDESWTHRNDWVEYLPVLSDRA